jgi:hypothetical protein
VGLVAFRRAAIHRAFTGPVASRVGFQTHPLPTFDQLKAIFKPYAAKMVVVHDPDTNCYLDTHRVMKNKHRIFFGAVRIGKPT